MLVLLGFSLPKLIHAPQLWNFLRTNFRGVEYYVGKTQHNMSLVILLFWQHRRDGIDNDSLRDRDTIPFIHGMSTCLSQLDFNGQLLVYLAGFEAWHCSSIIYAVVHTLKVLGSCEIVLVS